MIARTALELYQERLKQPSYIPFGCRTLDQVFRGVSTQGITEIAGEAGSGKTQICLSLAIQAVCNLSTRSINHYAAILSCGEGLFPIKRLSQLALYHEGNYGIPAKEILAHVDIEQCNNIDQATESLYKLLPEMCVNKSVKILIIDSLAGLLRFEFDPQKEEEMRERTQYMFSLATQLKWLSETYHLAVVIVNQVTADFRDGTENNHYSTSANPIPALGLAWSHCVNYRFRVLKPSRPSYLPEDATTTDSIEELMNTSTDNIENEPNLLTSNLGKRPLSDLFTSTDSNKLSNKTSDGPTHYQKLHQRRSLLLDFSPSQARQTVSFAITTQGLV